MFTNINLQMLLPLLDEAKTIRIQVLWTTFLELNKLFSKPSDDICDNHIETFEKKAKEWVINFIECVSCTPYIHAMFNHVGNSW